MSVPAPHFLLYAEAAQAADSNALEASRWRFVLRQPGGETSLEAADEEPEAGPERLELLAVVRGLEALEGPSRVTLLTGSRHIRRGLDFGLAQWRENDWQWERYGRMTPVKNCDLWQRLDRLLGIHRLECRPTRLEKADDLTPPPPAARLAEPTKRRGRSLRIDASHRAAKHQISSGPPLGGGARTQTNSKFKSKNDRNVAAGFRQWNFLASNLFGAWDWVLGAFGLKQRRATQQARSARRQRSFITQES